VPTPVATVMVTDITMNIDHLQLAQLLQLTSPSLPIGGFAWSQGTESAIDQGWLKGEDDFGDWLQGILHTGFVGQELPLLRKLVDAWQQQDQAQIEYWTRYSLALRETRELYQEDIQMGAALMRLTRDLEYPGALQWQSWQHKQVSYLTAFAMVAVANNIPFDAAATGLLWSWLENQIAAALKTFPMGQTAGQRIFQRLVHAVPDWIEQSKQVADDHIGLSLPGVVLASMQHERQYSRLFRS